MGESNNLDKAIISILQINKETSWGNELSPLAKETFSKLFGASLPNGIQGIQEKKASNFSTIIKNAFEKVLVTGTSPKEIPLKLLEPIINGASLEDDPDIQVMWSSLLANVLTKDQSIGLQRSAIDILSKMSSSEAKLLDVIYGLFDKKRENYLADPLGIGDKEKSLKQFNGELYSYNVSSFYTSRDYYAERDRISLLLSNLVAHGLIRWEVSVNVNDVDAPITHSGKADVDIDLEVVDDEYIKFTKLGIDFIELCKFKQVDTSKDQN